MSILTAGMMTLTACSSDDDMMDYGIPTPSENQVGIERTVLVYMAGRNDLSDTLKLDFNEIKVGSRYISDKQNLLVFVRDYDGAVEPWLARIRNGEVTDSVSLSDMGIRSSDGENRASDPAIMESVLQYAFRNYPSYKGEYGLVLWGHGSGWLMKEEVNRQCTRAFGSGNGGYRYSDDERWINIPTLAQILKGMPHLKYIMADCCNFMCLENLYELRDVCGYIIGLPAEIPGQGAPYYDIVPCLFADGQFYTTIIDKYYMSVNGRLPLTAVKTSERENLAQATRQAMQAVKEKIGDTYADMTGLIHYYYTDKPWRLIYSDFTVTAEKFHGVSMFVPQDPAKGNYAKYNDDIKEFFFSAFLV